MPENEYPVVLICDNNYVIPTAVAVRSMIDSFRHKGKLVVCIIACGVDETNKALFRRMKRRNIEIRIIDYDTKELTIYNEDGYYVTGTALVKFCIPRLLPEYDKILYVDGDVLIRKDLAEAFEIKIDDCYAAVVSDMAAVVSCNWHKRLGLKNYFNSGVLLLNAEKIRRENVEEKLFTVKKQHPDYCCMDQDVFNVVFNMNVKFLPQKWNMMMPNLLLMQKQMGLTLQDINSFFGTSYGSMKDMEQDAYILHLTNEKKPWKYSDIYMSQEWYKVFKKTPFKKMKLRRDEPLRSSWLGPFHKLTFEERTDLTFLGIPVARKRYNPPISMIWLLGIPVAKRIWYDYEIVTQLFFFIRFRKANWHNIEEKLDFCISMIRESTGDSSFARVVLSQLARARSTN